MVNSRHEETCPLPLRIGAADTVVVRIGDEESVLIEFGGDEGKSALRKWKASGSVNDARMNAMLAAALDQRK